MSQDANMDSDGTGCFTMSEGFPNLMHRAVLETFFLTPKINWKIRPVPEGDDGHLSVT